MQFRLRKTWPDNDNIFHVVNADGDTIARIALQNHVPHWQDKWEWSMAAFQYRHRPDFEDRCATREEAMQAVKERWPAYLAEMEYDGWMERVRRERFGVHTISFFYEDEPETALAEIEVLAGCLETRSRKRVSPCCSPSSPIRKSISASCASASTPCLPRAIGPSGHRTGTPSQDSS